LFGEHPSDMVFDRFTAFPTVSMELTRMEVSLLERIKFSYL
jgi:hypothetical protein